MPYFISKKCWKKRIFEIKKLTLLKLNNLNKSITNCDIKILSKIRQ